MNRYFLNATPCCDSQSAEMDVADNGEFYLVEDVDPIIADRDIKAANLQLLVEKVLAIDDAHGIGTHTANVAVAAAVNLARGLKQ